jgi:hypothetical protein
MAKKSVKLSKEKKSRMEKKQQAAVHHEMKEGKKERVEKKHGYGDMR